MMPSAQAPMSSGSGGSSLGNFFKTTLLLAALSGIVLALGSQLGGSGGLMVAFIFVVVMNFGSWWFSDKIALAMHRAKPLERAEAPWLFEMVERLARQADLPMPRLYLLPTDSPNAFATGRNPANAAVAVTQGLVDLMDRRELEGVVAHELAHVKNRDTLIGTVAATLAGVISWVAQSVFYLGGTFLSRDDEDEGGSAIANIGLVLVAPIAATLLQLAVSRTREYAADAEGARITGDPQGLARALAKLQAGAQARPMDHAPATSHLFIVNPLSGAAVMKLFATHPPIEERISRLQQMATFGVPSMA